MTLKIFKGKILRTELQYQMNTMFVTLSADRDSEMNILRILSEHPLSRRHGAEARLQDKCRAIQSTIIAKCYTSQILYFYLQVDWVETGV